MTQIEYFIYALKHGYLDNLDWYFAVLSLPVSDNTENKYLKYINKEYILKLEDGKEVKLLNSLKERPLLVIKDKVTLTKEEMLSIEDKEDTDVGIAIANYLLIEKPFQGKIKYINGEVKIKSIEAKIKSQLENGKENSISVKDYIKYADNAMFLSGIARLVTISATYKSVLPPPGIKEYKEKLIKEFKEKYGDDVFKDYLRVTELEAKLKEYDDEWLKDDPSYGKLISGKVKNVSRAKLYLMYGAEVAFDKKGIANTVTSSLLEGWPDDKEQLANMYNASRAGSYDRGAETQHGGVSAKVILRATNSIKIVKGDCGTKLGLPLIISNSNKEYIIGRNIITDNNIKAITEEYVNKNIGNTIILRSPSYCLTKDNNICEICAGKNLTEYKDAVSLIVLKLSSVLLGISMSSMHGVQLRQTNLDLDEAIT